MNDEPSLSAKSIKSVPPPEYTDYPPEKVTKSKKRNKYLPQQLPYILAGAGIIFLLFLAFRPTPIRVDVAKVRRDSLQVTVEEEGETRIRDRYVVSAPVTGRLARIQLSEGDRVTQGEIIAQIDPLPLEANVREAQARLRQWQAEKAGVETQRPKQEALLQAEARIRAAEAMEREAEAKVAGAKATLEQAQRERQRSQELYREGIIARQTLEQDQLEAITRATEWEAAQRQVETTIAEVRAAQEALALLRAQQLDPDYLLDVYDARIASVEAELTELAADANRTQIKAPTNGYVLRVNQESARYVEAGTPLLELGNPQDLAIVVDLLSTDAVKVKPGAKILIEHWGGDRTLQARVRYVEPSAFTKVSALGVEEQRVNVVADFVDNSVPLSDRYRIETRIVVWEGKDVLLIPLSALFRCDVGNKRLPGNTWCTFVVENNRAQKRQVEVSQRSHFEAVIAAGLKEGEVVIIHPSEEIGARTRVLPR